MAARTGRGSSPLPWIIGIALLIGVGALFAFAGTSPLRAQAAAAPATADAAAPVASASTPARVASPVGGTVKVETIVEGKGPLVLPDDTVAVIYTGKLMNGTVFDSNAGKAPLVFPLNQVIPGWQQGLQKMRAGGRAKLTIPAALGYGAAGAPPTIPPNADLVFDVQLIAIKPR